MPENISVGRLHQILRYCPETGSLFWRERKQSLAFTETTEGKYYERHDTRNHSEKRPDLSG